MNETSKTVTKNATVLMLSQIVTWSLALLLSLFLPRFLGAEAVGQLHFAYSLWAIVIVAVTFGMDQLLVKEIARSPEKTAVLVGNTFILRALLYGFGFGFVILYLNLLNYPLITVQITIVVGISQFFGLFVGAVQSALQGLEKMQYISLGVILGKATNTIIGITLLLMGYGVLVIASVAVVAALVSFVIQLFFLRKLTPIQFRFDWRFALNMLKSGTPYLFTYLFMIGYQQVDVIVISWLVDDQTVGWYSASDRLFGSSLFIPTVFMTAVFPVLSRLYADGSDSATRIMRKSFNMLLLLSVPIGLGLVVIANPLVVLLFGAEFAPSGPILAVTGIVILLTYQNMLLGQFVISIDRQNAWTIIMAVAAFATIPLDLIFVPWTRQQFGNGAIGGAMAFVVTELGMVVAGLMLLPKGTLNKQNGWFAVRVLAAGLIMAAAAWPLRNQFLLIPILTAAVVYLTLLILFRAVGKEELTLVQQALQSVTSRIRRRQEDQSKPISTHNATTTD